MINAKSEGRPRGGNYALLDLARGLAALFVAAEHLRAFTMVDFKDVASPNLLLKALYLLTGLGHQAVIVFFVLSGFLIGKDVYQTFHANPASWADYAAKRLSRLWIVLLPALALTALWDNIGIHVFHGAFYAGALNAEFLSGPSAAGTYGLSNFLASAFFLQTIVLPPFGSNGPLWSLANEFWYYVLFPLAFLSTRSFMQMPARAICAIATLVLCLLLPFTIVVYGLIWLCGFFVALLQLHLKIKWSATALNISLSLSALFFFAVLAYARFASSMSSGRSIGPDLICGVAFSVLLYVMISVQVKNSPLRGAAHFFSKFSYTLYLTHFPFIAVIATALLAGGRLQPSLASGALFLAVLLAALAYAYIVYLVFERKTGAVQTFLIRKIDERSGARTPASERMTAPATAMPTGAMADGRD